MAARNFYDTRTATTLKVVTSYREKDSYLMGALHSRKGWHWWWSAKDPEGHDLVSVVKGPFATEQAALDDARSKGATL